VRKDRLHTPIHGSDVTAELCDDDLMVTAIKVMIAHSMAVVPERSAAKRRAVAPTRLGRTVLCVVSVMVSLKLPTDRGERA
jgi:hypothetical protein